MDVGARALQEQVPRKYLPVHPVHRRYRRPASRDIPYILYIVATGVLPLATYRTSCTSSLPASCLSRHTVHPVHKKGGNFIYRLLLSYNTKS